MSKCEESVLSRNRTKSFGKKGRSISLKSLGTQIRRNEKNSDRLQVVIRKTPSESDKCITYNQILDMWLKSCSLRVKRSSYVRYCHIVDSHIREKLGCLEVSEIDNACLENYVSYLLNEGRIDKNGGLSPKTVSDILCIIKNSLKYAQANGITTRCCGELISVKRSGKGMRILTKSEQSTITDYLTTGADGVKFGILLSLYAGLRIGEVCALKWEDIDTSEGIVSVRHTLLRIQSDRSQDAKTEVIITAPKSASSVREIPLPDFLLELANDLGTDDDAYILTGKCDKYIEPRTLQNIFKRILDSCGIEAANYHALRHTFATRCVEIGFEIKSLSEILGHTNVNITLNKYVHPSRELKKQNMDKLNIDLSAKSI